MANKVRIGIIGFGGQGSLYVGFLKAGLIKGAVLGAVCDINKEKLEKQYAKFRLTCPKFTSHKELLESGTCDAVVVVTPHYYHPPIVIDALNAGLHAMSDKPAGVYADQVREMIKTADAHPQQVFALMLNQRTNKVYGKMRSMIAEGKIGEIKRFNWIITDWYRPQCYFDYSPWRATWKGEGGGVIFNQSPHQIDLLQWITGMMPEKIHSKCHFGKWHDIETEDDVTVYMQFPNGATGVFITSTADYPGTNRLEILGTKGKLVCTNGSKLVYYKSKTDEREFNTATKKGFSTPGMKKRTVKNTKISGQHLEILRNFAGACAGKEELKVNGREGIKGLEIMNAMLLSTWLDKEVTVPVDGKLYHDELMKRVATSKDKENVTEVVIDTKGSF